jgi:hypothetical protein
MSKSYDLPDTKEIKRLIREITAWHKDMDDTVPTNVQLDYDTFEGSAYTIMVKAKRILKEVLKYIDQ